MEWPRRIGAGCPPARDSGERVADDRFEDGAAEVEVADDGVALVDPGELIGAADHAGVAGAVEDDGSLAVHAGNKACGKSSSMRV